MNDFYSIPVVIPSYNPDEKLAQTVLGLKNAGFRDIIVIDDGSSAETKKNFHEPGDGVTVLRNEVNRGKGAGLKTAFRYILENRPDAAGCVTADGDGQHRTEDIAACAKAMLSEKDRVILGARDFSLPHVPERSKKGNRITSCVFRLLFGMKITDTQTGLRAIPRKYLAPFIRVSGDRYEYETNMLLSMKRDSIPFSEVKIDTVYIDDNQTSHFRPVRDSIRIYGLILSFVLSSVISFLIDTGLFTLFNIFLFSWNEYSYAISLVCARVISSSANYLINRRVVFQNGEKSSVVRYYILAAVLLTVSASVGQLFSQFLSLPKPVETVIKIAVDLVMFIVSFRMQHTWVFKNKSEVSEK